jgi:hypothetical protein
MQNLQASSVSASTDVQVAKEEPSHRALEGMKQYR